MMRWREPPPPVDWRDAASVARWIEHVRWSAFFDGARGNEISKAEADALVIALASGIETEGEDPAEGLRAKHESPTAEGGDAHTPPEGSVQQTRGGDR